MSIQLDYITCQWLFVSISLLETNNSSTLCEAFDIYVLFIIYVQFMNASQFTNKYQIWIWTFHIFFQYTARRECCVQRGVRRSIAGVPGALRECPSTEPDQVCSAVDSRCCECCKLGQLIRIRIGVEECPIRAVMATFGECRSVFLACCLNTTGMCSILYLI